MSDEVILTGQQIQAFVDFTEELRALIFKYKEADSAMLVAATLTSSATVLLEQAPPECRTETAFMRFASQGWASAVAARHARLAQGPVPA